MCCATRSLAESTGGQHKYVRGNKDSEDAMKRSSEPSTEHPVPEIVVRSGSGEHASSQATIDTRPEDGNLPWSQKRGVKRRLNEEFAHVGCENEQDQASASLT